MYINNTESVFQIYAEFLQISLKKKRIVTSRKIGKGFKQVIPEVNRLDWPINNWQDSQLH